MDTRIIGEINTQDCKEGVRGNTHYCVLEVALGRLVPEATHLEITTTTVRFSVKVNDKRQRWVYASSPAIREYIRDFDAGKLPRPMKFVLENPQITEVPTPKPGTARRVSFRAQGPAKTMRSRRVWGERSYGSP